MLPRGLVHHPACISIAPYLARLEGRQAWPSVAELDALFADRLRLLPAVELEEQQPGKKPRGRDSIYEMRVHASRKIPTRPGSWHDLMNLLVWCAFPQSKRALSARQHAIVSARVAPDATKLPSARTREQDALAMLDEGGALLVAPDGEVDLGRPTEVIAKIHEGRIALRLFGHALLEAVAEGRLAERDLRGAVVILSSDEPLDAQLATLVETPTAFTTPDPTRSLWLRAALGAELSSNA